MLAAHLEAQEWVAEELVEVMKEDNAVDLNYTEIYPRFKRCQAVLVGIFCRRVKVG